MKALRESIGLALMTLYTHPLRSLLTVVGVMIGSSCVIIIGSILTGMDQSIVKEMQGFGAETIFIYKYDPGIRTTRPTPEERMRKPLDWEDFEHVRDSCGAVKNASVVLVGERGNTARYKNLEFRGSKLEGGLPDYPDIMNVSLERGRCFTAAENSHRRNVCIVGSDLAKTLFVNIDPLGKLVTVDGHPFEVIGVIAPKKAAGPLVDTSRDGGIVLPYLTFRKVYPLAKEHFMVVQAFPGRLNLATEQVRASLRVSRRDRPGKPDSFGITMATAIVEQFRDIMGNIALVIFVLSSVGLMVGGVGVMNIMLVSVTERTREIGIRKALGARKLDIMLQFLMEAGTLTGCGGMAGILMGVLISAAINTWVPSMPSIVPMWAVGLGFCCSVGIGVVFGLWPAMRAARLNPVDALRYE
jgi:putative ABC transport system permease protein